MLTEKSEKEVEMRRNLRIMLGGGVSGLVVWIGMNLTKECSGESMGARIIVAGVCFALYVLSD